MEASLEELRDELQRAELAVEGVAEGKLEGEGLSEARRAAILAHIESIEEEMKLDSKETLVEEERRALGAQLNWLESLIGEAEKEHASEIGDMQGLQMLLQREADKEESQALVSQLAGSRASLQHALLTASAAGSDLAGVMKAALADEKVTPVLAETIEGQLEALNAALEAVKDQAEVGSKSEEKLGSRLAVSESYVGQQQREIRSLRERVARGGGPVEEGVLELEVLQEENLALEDMLQKAMDANGLASRQIRLLEAKLRDRNKSDGGGGGEGEVAEPEEEAMPEEHLLRKRLRNEQAADHDCVGGLVVQNADVAELALIWGMRLPCAHYTRIPFLVATCTWLVLLVSVHDALISTAHTFVSCDTAAAVCLLALQAWTQADIYISCGFRSGVSRQRFRSGGRRPRTARARSSTARRPRASRPTCTPTTPNTATCSMRSARRPSLQPAAAACPRLSRTLRCSRLSGCG